MKSTWCRASTPRIVVKSGLGVFTAKPHDRLPAPGVEREEVAVHAAAEDEIAGGRQEPGGRLGLDLKLPAPLPGPRIDRPDGADEFLVRLVVVGRAADEHLPRRVRVAPHVIGARAV